MGDGHLRTAFRVAGQKPLEAVAWGAMQGPLGPALLGARGRRFNIAGKLELSHLIVLWDDNGITIDGKVEISDVTDQKQRFLASGWDVLEVDGHDPEAIDAAIAKAKTGKKPTMIACKTHIALGHAAQDTSKGHGALTNAEQLLAAKAAYGWDHGAFEIPADVKSEWEAIGARGAAERAEWEARLAALGASKRAEFERAIAIRRMQIANDQHALREWRNALRQADQFWAENPNWNFGDCLDAILAKGGTALGGEAVQ